jgi:MscS family membrane protein
MAFLSTIYYGNTVQEYLYALLVILAIALVAKVIYWVLETFVKKFTAKTKTKADDLILDVLQNPLVLVIALIGVYFVVTNMLTLSATAAVWFWNTYQIVIILNIAWFLSALFESIIEQYISPLTEKSESTLDDQLLPILSKGIKTIIWVLAIIIGLNNAGYNVGALLAGLGIGGLAFALAAKDTIENIFGGFTIFTDKPFKLGDRIKINGHDGTVEEIGLRSTRLRTLSGEVVTMPNKHFSSDAVENVSLRPNIKIVLDLGLTYDTTPAQMEKAKAILQKIADNNKSVKKSVMAFTSFGDFSLGIKFIYWFKGSYFGVQDEMNSDILTQFNKAGLDFAFPSQTIYTKKG